MKTTDVNNPMENCGTAADAKHLLSAERCCLFCLHLNCSTHPLPDELFQYGCDKLHFIGVGDEEQFKTLKTETTCLDFTPCR